MRLRRELQSKGHSLWEYKGKVTVNPRHVQVMVVVIEEDSGRLHKEEVRGKKMLELKLDQWNTNGMRLICCNVRSMAILNKDGFN